MVITINLRLLVWTLRKDCFQAKPSIRKKDDLRRGIALTPIRTEDPVRQYAAP